MRRSRVCYNHLAGELGTELFDALLTKGVLSRDEDQLVVAPGAERFWQDFGIDITALKKQRSQFCAECLDWSERKSHLSGSLGRAVFSRIEDNGWARREPNTRIVRFSPDGEIAFRNWLRQ